MEFISNLIKRPMSLVLSDSTTPLTPDRTSPEKATSEQTSPVQLSNEQLSPKRDSPTTASNMGEQPVVIAAEPHTPEPVPSSSSAPQLVDDEKLMVQNNSNLLQLEPSQLADAVKFVESLKTTNDLDHYEKFMDAIALSDPQHNSTTVSTHLVPHSTSATVIEELLIEINDNLDKVGFTDENIVTASDNAMVSTVKLSPLSSKALPAKLTPTTAARLTPNSQKSSANASSPTALSATSGTVVAMEQPLFEDANVANGTFNQSFGLATAIVDSSVNLTKDFDDAVAVFTNDFHSSHHLSEFDEAINAAAAAEAGYLDIETAVATQQQIEPVNEVEGNHYADRESLPGDRTFDDEAMDVDMSFNVDEVVDLKPISLAQFAEALDQANQHNQQLEQPSGVVLNRSIEKARLTFGVDTTNQFEPKAITLEQQQELAATALNRSSDKSRLTFGIDTNAAQFEETSDQQLEEPTQTAEEIFNVAAAAFAATPQHKQLNLTLDVSDTFCSAKSSAANSPMFPTRTSPSSKANEFPRSPESEHVKHNVFLEDCQYAAETLLKPSLRIAASTPQPAESSLNHTLEQANMQRAGLLATGKLNNTFNGTANVETTQLNATDRRRTFNVVSSPGTIANSQASLDKFPLKQSEPEAHSEAAADDKKEFNRRRTFNLSDVGEQQPAEVERVEPINESLETMDIDVSMNVETQAQAKNHSLAETFPLAAPETAEPNVAFRSNSPPLPTHQAKRMPDAMTEFAENADVTKASPEAAAVEVKQEKVEELQQPNEVQIGDAENKTAFRSTSPPLPTHQAKKLAANQMEEFELATQAPASIKLDSTMPNLTAAGDGPHLVPKMPSPLPIMQQIKVEPAEIAPSPPLPAQQARNEEALRRQLQEDAEFADALNTALPRSGSSSPAPSNVDMNSSYSIAPPKQQPDAVMHELSEFASPPMPTRPAAAVGGVGRQHIRQSILSTIEDFQLQLPTTAAISKRPPIHNETTEEPMKDPFRTPPGVELLSAKEKTKNHLKDEKDVFDEMFAKPFGGCSGESAGNQFDFQQHQQQKEFEEEFSNQSNGNNNVPVDRSSLLLRFDPLLGVPMPVNQSQQQQQEKLQQILAAAATNTNTITVNTTNNNNNNNQAKQLSPTAEEESEAETSRNSSYVNGNNNPIGISPIEPADIGSARTADLTKEKSDKKNASMSVDIIKDSNIDNDCNKGFDNSSIQQSDDKQINYRMDELEKKIQNEVSKTEDIEKKLKEAEQREEALLKRIKEKDKNMAKMNGVIEAYEKAIAELIAEKEQLILNYEKQMQEIKVDRDSNYHHLTSLETTFSDLHVKYEKSKEMTLQLKANEEALLAEKRQNLENLRLQEQRYEKMKNHAMQQLEIANNKLDSLGKMHAIETTKLKALLKKEEISRASINEQLQQKSRENSELVKICDELINGQGS